MNKSVLKKTIFFNASCLLFFATATLAQPAPELVFRNPVLVSGTALKEGAVYKFPDVMAGVDAHVKLKKFSRKDIVMATIDNTTTGWEKAFQPEFGLPGVVQPFQNWYIDFEMEFYKAGTTSKQSINKVVATALDVDGDNNSISEYYVMKDPDSIKYASISYLQGTRTPSRLCGACGTESDLMTCSNCNGTGNKNYADPKKKWEADDNCNGTGKLHTACGHAFSNQWNYEMSSTIQNFAAIDTLSTQVMATYIYLKEDGIKFRIGATSGARSSNGSGIRLNSLWFKSFSLNTPHMLPVQLTALTASLKAQTVTLNWATASEDAFSHFVVERSADGKTFSQIGVVLAAGGEIGTTTYMFKDVPPATANVVQYRLRMVDLDLSTDYSAAVSIRVARQMDNTIAINTYPNPAQHQLNVSVPAPWQGKAVDIAIYNSNGVRVELKQCARAGARETVQISHLSRGTYIISASSRGALAQQAIYKQ